MVVVVAEPVEAAEVAPAEEVEVAPAGIPVLLPIRASSAHSERNNFF